MSTQTQPPPPVVVYPNPVNKQPSSHSNGSFGSVFIVLAVIVVVSALACFLGRLCNRRSHPHPPNAKPQGHHSSRRDRDFRVREGDIEFGLDREIPAGKLFGNIGEDRAGQGGNLNGEIPGEPRFASAAPHNPA